MQPSAPCSATSSRKCVAVRRLPCRRPCMSVIASSDGVDRPLRRPASLSSSSVTGVKVLKNDRLSRAMTPLAAEPAAGPRGACQRASARRARVPARRVHERTPMPELAFAPLVQARDRVAREHDAEVTLAGLVDRGPRAVGEVAAAEHQRCDPRARRCPPAGCRRRRPSAACRAPTSFAPSSWTRPASSAAAVERRCPRSGSSSARELGAGCAAGEDLRARLHGLRAGTRRRCCRRARRCAPRARSVGPPRGTLAQRGHRRQRRGRARDLEPPPSSTSHCVSIVISAACVRLGRGVGVAHAAADPPAAAPPAAGGPPPSSPELSHALPSRPACSPAPPSASSRRRPGRRRSTSWRRTPAGTRATSPGPKRVLHVAAEQQRKLALEHDVHLLLVLVGVHRGRAGAARARSG